MRLGKADKLQDLGLQGEISTAMVTSTLVRCMLSDTHMLVNNASHLNGMQQGLQLEDAATLVKPELQEQRRTCEGKEQGLQAALQMSIPAGLDS